MFVKQIDELFDRSRGMSDGPDCERCGGHAGGSVSPTVRHTVKSIWLSSGATTNVALGYTHGGAFIAATTVNSLTLNQFGGTNAAGPLPPLVHLHHRSPL